MLALDAVLDGGARGEGRRRDALLHGRRVARARGDRDLAPVLDMVRGVKALGLEACCTLGMLKDGQAQALARRGPRLLQPQPRHRARVLRRDRHDARASTTGSTRSSACATRACACAAAASSAWASRAARAPALIAQLASLDPPPESVPINELVQVEGTPLARAARRRERDRPAEFVRTIAVARILMPRAMVRLSAGRARARAKRCRRCASSPAPTRSSTATSCSPPATRTSTPTARSSPSSVSSPRR